MSKIEEALKKAAQERQLQRVSETLTDPDSLKVIPPPKKGLEKPLLIRHRLITLTAPQSPAAEQYKKLRTRILQLTKPDFQNTLMVTSAVAGEGKTLTALNLAITIAQGLQETVLLVDGDLRKSSLHKLLGIEPKYGLSDYLTRHLDLSKILIKTEINKLTILPAGNLPPNPAELLASQKMHNLIKEIKNRYEDRYVIFDTTPLLPTTDPNILGTQMDGVILVVQAGRTAREDVVNALKLLEGMNVLGIVLNNVHQVSSNYYYHY
ncbi:MAG TPA: XrtA-associated tyrosine autokinase [Candidatus Limnocylindrales bacterium]|nr:XrtA-associated tyrosine autokinase [Candidatus Limnocylindrales bacterium]